MKLDKAKLDNLYNKYMNKSFIEKDPVQFIHLFSGSKKDQEVVGFIASALSFGKRDKIIISIKEVLSHLGLEPFKSLFYFKIKDISRLESFIYRFVKGIDIIQLFYRIHIVLNKYKSLENLFGEGFKKDNSIKTSVTHFVDVFNSINLSNSMFQTEEDRTRTSKFLIPSPIGGSACKRLNLYLRWMVRKDLVDIGIWDSIPQNALLIPVDTHVARVSKSLSLTERKSADWRMAEEITKRLKEFNPDDPVKYDFALFGYGIDYQKSEIN